LPQPQFFFVAWIQTATSVFPSFLFFSKHSFTFTVFAFHWVEGRFDLSFY